MSGAPDGAKRIIAQHMAGQEPQSLFGLAASVPRSYLQRTNDAWNSGLDMANRGAQALQGGDLSGAAGMVLGPLGAVTAPITGIFPDREFVREGSANLGQQVGISPSFAAALGVGALDAAATLGGGPEVKAAEGASALGQAKKGLVTQSYKEIMPDGTERWVPGTLRVNPPKERFDPEMSPADVARYIQQNGEAPRNWPKGRIETASYKDHYPDGTSEWVPGLLRAKRPPK